jgi:hypothetical protein
MASISYLRRNWRRWIAKVDRCRQNIRHIYETLRAFTIEAPIYHDLLRAVVLMVRRAAAALQGADADIVSDRPNLYFRQPGQLAAVAAGGLPKPVRQTETRHNSKTLIKPQDPAVKCNGWLGSNLTCLA